MPCWYRAGPGTLHPQNRGGLILAYAQWLPFERGQTWGWREQAMALLQSYVNGDWVTPAGDGRPVFDAVTGEEIARVPAAGIDMAAALSYGRSVGGPALRDLTFHQRAG